VKSVRKGSQAEEMGVQRFDVIVGVNGQSVKDAEKALETMRASARARSSLTLDLVRGGKRTTLTR
jgi:S1-C subfamily serine protease